MDKNSAWACFYATGAVEDYLNYVSAIEGEQENEDKHGRVDTQTGSGR